MYQCSVCEYKSMYRFNVDRHEKAKHSKPNSTSLTISNNVTHQTGSDAEQSIQPHSQNDKHSNLQKESIDQLYENIGQLHENIDQWQKAYDALKQQYQQVEKVTTSNDGRPSHVSIQLYDKSCNALKAYMDQCQRFQNKKEQFAQACGLPVGRRSGGRLAMTLVATINVIIFSFFSFFFFLFLFFLLRRLLFS